MHSAQANARFAPIADISVANSGKLEYIPSRAAELVFRACLQFRGEVMSDDPVDS